MFEKPGDQPPVPPWWESYAGEFPGWQAWRGTSGLVYARQLDATPPVVVRGEDADDLRNEIIRAQTRANVWTDAASRRRHR